MKTVKSFLLSIQFTHLNDISSNGSVVELPKELKETLKNCFTKAAPSVINRFKFLQKFLSIRSQMKTSFDGFLVMSHLPGAAKTSKLLT